MREKRRVFHEEIDGEGVVLSLEESHHVARVLRLKVGDVIEVFDGRGGCRQARIKSIGKRDAHVMFVSPKEVFAKPVPRITLAVVPPKGQRMDTLVQMMQEIGLDELIPIISEHSGSRKVSTNRFERWRRISIAAAKQSGANYLVEIGTQTYFSELVGRAPDWDLTLVCHTGPKCPQLRDVLPGHAAPGKILLVVGPEGGFSAQEVAEAQQAGCTAVKLPAPTLRVETAAVFALSALCYQFGRGSAR